LLQATSDCINENTNSLCKLSQLIAEILYQANTTARSATQDYSSYMHSWIFPATADLLNLATQNDNKTQDSLSESLLLLSMFLVTRALPKGSGGARMSVLYITVLQIHAHIQAAGTISLDVVRARMLVVIYEISHGLLKQAHVTLSCCLALFSVQYQDAEWDGDSKWDRELIISVGVGLLFLDRYFHRSI
jgi:hypothetical protein